MNRLVFFVLLGLVAIASAQWGNQNQQNYPQQFPSQFPQNFPQNYPNPADMCKQPGANCKIDSRFAEESSVTDNRGNTVKTSRVCDDRGCYDKKVYNGSSALTISTILMTICAVFVGAKIFLQ